MANNTLSGGRRPVGPTALVTAATVLVALAFLVPAVALILLGVNRGTQAADAAEYHLPTIARFAADWPHLDLAAARAAMTPGYHLLMTGVYSAAGGDVRAVQLATAAVTAGLLATLAWAVGRRAGWADAVLLCLPVAWSPYVFTSGVYAVPHNLSWWAVLAGLLLALRARVGVGFYLAAGAVLLVAVLTRQIHVWLLAPLCVAAFCGDGARGDGAGGGRPLPARFKRAALAAAAGLPAVAALACFVHLWGGLAPKTQDFARPAGGVNVAALAMMLATAGALGLWFAGYLRVGGRAWQWGAVGAVAAILVAAAGPTTYDMAAGRWGGLWALAKVPPVVGGRSVAIVLAAAAGGLVLGWVLAALRPRDRWVTAAALASFAAAHAAVNLAWQRYYEPMVLVVLALSAAEVVGHGTVNVRSTWVRRGLLAGLAVAQAVATVVSLRA